MSELTRVLDLLEVLEESERKGVPKDPKTICYEMGCEELLGDLEKANRHRLLAGDTLDAFGDSTVVSQCNSISLLGKELSQKTSYKITELASGEGGLGLVYKATDAVLHRTVAVKVLRENRNLSPEDQRAARERFELEAEITSRLDHPGVPAVHGIGELDDGQPYYAMDFVEGRTLDEEINEYHDKRGGKATDASDVAFRKLLQAFIAVCKVIAHAHDRLIVHRDVKPANIVLGRFGETAVLDWGLATPLNKSDENRVRVESTLQLRRECSEHHYATYAYMAPEQAAKLPVGRASDIYNLGATLYKAITGKAPIDDASTNDIERRVLFGDIPSAREVKSSVSPVLEAICRKAMSVKPEDRYATALDLADAVESFLADKCVPAYREPASRKIARWARRHRAVAQVGVMALILVSVISAVFAVLQSHSAHDANAARIRADRALADGEKERKAALQASARLASSRLGEMLSVASTALEQLVSDPGFTDEVANTVEELKATDVSHSDYRTTITRLLNQPVESRTTTLSHCLSLNRLLRRHRLNWEYQENGRATDSNAGIRGIKLGTYAWMVQAAWKVQANGSSLTDYKGPQVARHPLRSIEGEIFGSIGQDLSQREYFELTGGTRMSAPFEGSNGTPAVVLSRPIRHQGTAVGVAGIAFELHAITQVGDVLDAADSDSDPDRILTLVHAGHDTYDGQNTGTGLILQHHYFNRDVSSNSKEHAHVGLGGHRVDKKTLAELVRHAQSGTEELYRGYRDPIGSVNPEYEGSWEVAVTQVPQIDDWLVLVQTRNDY